MNHPSPPPFPAGFDPASPDEGELYHVIFHAAFDPMILSEDGRVVDLNEAAMRVFGYQRAEVSGTDILDYVAPESRTQVAQMVGTGREILHELQLVRKDGSRFEAEAQARLLRVGGHNLRLTVLRDITERRLNAESLHDSQTKLGLALGLARLGQWEMDLAKGEFTFDDDLFRLLGTTAEREGGYRMMAQDYARRFMPPDGAAIVAREVELAITTTDPRFTRQLEHEFIRADGSLGIMLVRFAIVKDAQGRTVRTYGVNQDITELRLAEQQRVRLEEQLQQAQKMEALGTLAGGIAHDFNNILTGILGQLQLAALDLPDTHPAREAVGEAAKAGRRARELVARILAFSRRSQLDRKPHPLAPIVQEAVHLLRASLPATIGIRTVFDPDCPPVLCDSARIHQILMNLGTNAAHAMRDRTGVMSIEVSRVKPDAALIRRHPQINPGHTVRLTISDNGLGMEEAVLKRIFEPFFTTKGTGEGSGLGLTMVYSIVQDHQGAITVTSTPGAGTTFQIYFPAAPAAAIAPAAPPAIHPAMTPFGRGRRVMLVEDDDAVRQVGLTMLTRLGFEPQAFADPLAALAKFQQHPDDYCAVVSDLTMPGMTGAELAGKILALRPALPLILASGHLNTETAKHGVRHTIAKPYDINELAGLLRRLLDGSASPPGNPG